MKKDNNANFAECLKDSCIIIHGLSKSNLPFDYTNPKLRCVLEYVGSSSDCDIYFDVSTALCNMTNALVSKIINSFWWICSF